MPTRSRTRLAVEAERRNREQLARLGGEVCQGRKRAEAEGLARARRSLLCGRAHLRPPVRAARREPPGCVLHSRPHGNDREE